MLRLPGGAWRIFDDFPTISGSTCCKLYVDIDKNARAVKKERDSKRLRKALENTHPNLNFRINLHEGSCSVNGIPVAQVKIIDNDASSVIEWNNAATTDIHLDREAINMSYDNLNTNRTTVSAADVTWSG
eukprot:1621831-Heterocapsa_arctica.AAC.1